MNIRDIPVPPRLQRRPVDPRGYPIPYTVPVVNGVPQFRTTDLHATSYCIKNHLCGMCGQELVGWIAVIGGPDEFSQKVFSDPGMHEECARYALEACPFLSNPDFRYQEPKDVPGVVMLDNPLNEKFRPDKIGFAVIRKYEECRINSPGRSATTPGILVVGKFYRMEWRR